MQAQTIMVMEPCSRCGQPIAPGEPAMQTASVDPVSSTGQALGEYGRAVSSPVKAYHLSGRCYVLPGAANPDRVERLLRRRRTRRVTNRINGRS